MNSSVLAARTAMRTVATLELVKAGAALALAFGFVSAQRHGLHELAVLLVGQLHLDPASHLPALIVGWSDRLQQVHPGQMISVALLYAALRVLEGGGLWFDQAWAEWLSVLSTGLYLPFELFHLFHRPGLMALVVVLLNVAIVVLMGWRLRSRHPRRSSP